MTEGPPNNPPQDLPHALQLLRDLAVINARTVRELGPLPPGGLPQVHKRKPDLPRPAAQTPMLTTIGTEEDDAMYWSKIAASTALAAVAALSACGVEGAPDDAIQPAAAEVAPMSAPPEAPAAAQLETLPQPAPAVGVQGPTISALQLRRRILDLIDSIQGPEDMSRAHLEKMMGVRLVPSQESTDYWRHQGMTDAGWGYAFGIQEERGEDLPHFTIGFSSNDGQGNAFASVCSYDLLELADEIVARDYIRKPRWAQPRAHLLFNRFSPDRSFGVTVQMFKYVQQTGPDPEQYRYCVETIYITAGVPFRD